MLSAELPLVAMSGRYQSKLWGLNPARAEAGRCVHM